jgi:two-component system cell cycle response regulator
LPIIILLEDGSDARLLRGLDMGVNDYLMRPIERHELLARVMTQIKRKRHTDFLRDQIEESFELAVTDGLTGLHNRRYMETHLATLVSDAARTGRDLSVLITDIDHFKAINDTYGHDAGDAVLKAVAARLKRNTRNADLACRLGGEEFLLILPDTALSGAYQIGERIRSRIASEAFQTGQGTRIRLTASVGIAALDGENDTPESLVKRADNALYAAKRRGRNRIASSVA